MPHFIMHLAHRLDQNPGVFQFRSMVFNLCICHTEGQRKALCTLWMLKLSFLGYETGFKACYTYRELVLALENEDIYRDGGRESL